MDLLQVLELLKTPFGVAGLATLAFLFMAKGNAKLADAVKDTVLSRIAKLEEYITTIAGQLKANTSQMIELHKVVVAVREDIARLESDLKEMRKAMRHDDDRRADLIARMAALNVAFDRAVETAKTNAAKLREQQLDSTHTRLKKTGNDPGEKQGG